MWGTEWLQSSELSTHWLSPLVVGALSSADVSAFWRAWFIESPQDASALQMQEQHKAATQVMLRACFFVQEIYK